MTAFVALCDHLDRPPPGPADGAIVLVACLVIAATWIGQRRIARRSR